MDKLVLSNLQDYINKHIEMQLNCFNLSKKCDEFGYPGFTHFFQVQAQDEFLHQRRIMNYILNNQQDYKIGSIEIKTFELKNIEGILKEYWRNIEGILKEYISLRKNFIIMTNEFTNNAKNKNDFATVKFYEWFAIDFYEEISEINDLLDWIKMSNGNHYEIDKKVLKRENPVTLEIISPFSPHLD